MLTHEQIWQAIDRLAQSFGYSTSGLAKQAGLDSTSFNKSKRISPEGKPRWPSTESISRVLAATGATMHDFISLVDDLNTGNNSSALTIPVIGFAQAGTQGFFDEDGYPAGDSWDEVRFPDYNANNTDGFYALEVNGSSMEPLYRDGDVIVVSPEAKLRLGDRIVLKTTGGEIMAKELLKQNASRVEVRSLNPDHKDREFSVGDIAWMGRIVWVSQ
jgi:phage repressor protein C with HTH and peptisase S24 domain